MSKKRKPSPNWRQDLVNAQTEVNRAVHAMNMLGNPEYEVDGGLGAIKQLAENACQDLRAVVERLK